MGVDLEVDPCGGRRHTTGVTGPPAGAALPTSRDYQLTIIGGFSDGFHFYPVIVHDRR